MSGIRRFVSSLIERKLKQRLPGPSGRELKEPTVIIVPHPDDETLGCGGTICKMTSAGSKVHFVFVTDGGASHGGHGREELSAAREEEAIEAVQHLGAKADDITFLRFPDGGAGRHLEEIAARIEYVLEALDPRSVFVPHSKDPQADHIAARSAARLALDRRGRPVTIYEYPVWYWYHWPWVPVFGDPFGLWRTALRQTLAARFGLGALWTFNLCVEVGEVLHLKEKALAAHISQTTRPDGNTDWPVLSDLGKGGFLGRLMSKYEFLTEYTLAGDGAESKKRAEGASAIETTARKRHEAPAQRSGDLRADHD